jgi:uncharacterized membrane protein
MEQQIYNILSGIVFIFLALIWNTSSVLNTSIKLILIFLSIASLFINLHSFGFIISV